MRPGQEERILHLFTRGHSLDLVCELGALYGWTRAEAKAVLAKQGWSLDWSGRLQACHRTGNRPVWPTVAQADPERLLNAGIDHEDPDIRRVAVAAERAVERLRGALLRKERTDAEDAVARSLGAALPPSGAFGGMAGPGPGVMSL